MGKRRPILRAGRRVAQRLYGLADELNRRNILSLLTRDKTACLLDLGCDDGLWTAMLGARIQARRVCGVEIISGKSVQASNRGLLVVRADLSCSWPFLDATFDVVHSNQVIEHVPDIDFFVEESVRVLRPGGYAVFSTENASSWHNIGAAVMGWQIFSATNVSKRVAGLGNPLALHRGSNDVEPSWTHKTVMNYRGLLELLTIHGFTKPTVLGAGYHPLPAAVARLDARHAHFLAVRVEKALIVGDH